VESETGEKNLMGSSLRTIGYGAKPIISLKENDHIAFIWLFIITFIYHLLYIYLTGLDLAPDEVHYWEWSRRLGLSYYSKGPAVAYVIAFFTAIFGDNPLGVRAGAVIFSQIILFVSYFLTWKLFGKRIVAFLVALVTQLIPLAYGLFIS